MAKRLNIRLVVAPGSAYNIDAKHMFQHMSKYVGDNMYHAVQNIGAAWENLEVPGDITLTNAYVYILNYSGDTVYVDSDGTSAVDGGIMIELDGFAFFRQPGSTLRLKCGVGDLCSVEYFIVEGRAV